MALSQLTDDDGLTFLLNTRHEKHRPTSHGSNARTSVFQEIQYPWGHDESTVRSDKVDKESMLEKRVGNTHGRRS